VAGTHAEVNDTVRPIAPFLSDNTNPAGGIMSGANDMAKWMILQLDSGRVSGGSRLYSSASTSQLWREVTPMPIGPVPAGLSHLRPQLSGYALGLDVRDYRGKYLLQHTGGLPGYLSKVAMLPELRVGVAVLTNQESGAAFNAIAYRVLDHYLGVKAPDYPAVYADLARKDREELRAALRRAATGRDSTSGPSLPLERYAGTYRDPWYGDVVIDRDGPGLAIRFTRTPSLVGDLIHWQHDTFLARWRDRELRADAYVTFSPPRTGPSPSFDRSPPRRRWTSASISGSGAAAGEGRLGSLTRRRGLELPCVVAVHHAEPHGAGRRADRNTRGSDGPSRPTLALPAYR
jgi:hypothetical protein